MWTASERLRWQFVFGNIGFIVLGCLAVGLSVSYEAFTTLLVTAGLTAVGVFYRVKRDEPRVATTLIALAQLSLFALSLAIASYVIVRFNRPLVDAFLYQLDHLLGFDWLHAFTAANKISWLSTLLIAAYNSSPVQIVLITVLLGLTLQTQRLEKFLEAFMIGGIMTLSIWAIYPSFGAATYTITAGLAEGFPNLTSVLPFVKPQLALLSGQMTTIEISEITGIVGAPSYHTVMALVSTYAFKDRGIWFVGAAAWNIIVLFSVPIYGCHHMVDVFAGAAVAVTSIAIAERLAALRAAGSAQTGHAIAA